jgi:hypothetical protein
VSLVLLAGCWAAEERPEMEECACPAPGNFGVSVRIQPTLDIDHDFSIEVCRGADCLVHRAADGVLSGPMRFQATGKDDSWNVEVWGNWPSQAPLREGEVLGIRVTDGGDGRTLADAELTLAAEPYSPNYCVQARPLSCTKLTASRGIIDFRRACVPRDCDSYSGTSLAAVFDPARLLTESERSGLSPYLARACQGDTCAASVLHWKPGESQRVGYDACAEFDGSPNFGLGSNPMGNAVVSAKWDDQLGPPGEDTVYSLALYRGTSASEESLIIERQGSIEVSTREPILCDPRGLVCERFHRVWEVE